MNSYNYCLKLKYPDGREAHVSGSVSCKNFETAVVMVMNDEEADWDTKRAQAEIIYIIKVQP